MTCAVKGNDRSCAGTAIAVIVVMASGYLMVSGTTAETALVEDRTESRENDKTAEASPNDVTANVSSAQTHRNETIVPKQYLGADISDADKADAPADSRKKPRKKSKSTNSAFRSDPKYD